MVRSEVELSAQFGAEVQSVSDLLINCAGRDFTVEAELFGYSETSTDFAGYFSFVLFTVYGDDGRTTLDVPGATVTEVAIKSYVEVSYGACVVITGPTSVVLYVDVGTSKGSGGHEWDCSNGCDYMFIHVSS